MTEQVVVKDKSALRRLGIEALNEKLGPIGMIEFLQQFDSGYGDYTKERHNWLGQLTLETISAEITAMKSCQ